MDRLYQMKAHKPASAHTGRAVLSADAVTTRFPSELNAALHTAPSWPFKTAIKPSIRPIPSQATGPMTTNSPMIVINAYAAASQSYMG